MRILDRQRRARCASGSRRASGGRAGSSSARSAAPNRRRRGRRRIAPQDLLPLKPARPGRKYSPPAKPPEAEPFVGERAPRGRDCPRRRRSKSPSPAISTSRTSISVTIALRRAVGQHDVDGRDRGLAVAHAELHLLDAGSVDRPRRAFAVVEAPDAALVRRQDARRGDPDAVVGGTEIGFALAVALAEFQQPAGAVDAQPLDRVARPAAAVARRAPAAARSPARCRRVRRDVAVEIGLVAEQAEAVLHLPLDPGRRRARRGQRLRRTSRPERRDQGRERRIDACSPVEMKA